MSSETSFISKQPKLEPKLVSELSETRRLFRLFRFKIETGSFSVLKQPKQSKDNRNSSKLVKISTFLIPYTISSVFFRLFRYRSETSKQTEKKVLGFAKSKPKNNRNRLSFGLFRFEPRKKINGFEYSTF